MDVRYPENTVWYIEARSTSAPRADGKYDSCGSGVVIWLRKRGESGTGRRYLLTCAHVLRGESADGAAGYGPAFDDLRVWPPGVGFAPDAASVAHVAHQVKPVNQGSVPPELRIAVHDWVILDVADEAFRTSAVAVKACVEAQEGEQSIIGYPGGSKSFLDHLVKPARSGGFRFRDLHDRVVRLHGNEARPGMSGGGLFDAKGDLVGIHRSRADAILECHSLSAVYIKQELRALGYDVEVRQDDDNPPPAGPIINWSRRTLLLGTLVAAVAGGLAAPRIWPAKHVEEPAVTPAVEPIAKPAIICRIYDAETHERILRAFIIKHGDRSQRCAVHESQLQVDPSFFAGQEELQIECTGYEPKPVTDCTIEENDTADTQGAVRHFCLTRNEAYLLSVLPNVHAIDHLPPTGEIEILSRRNNPKLTPDRITLLVKNEVDYRPDILLLPMLPPQEPHQTGEKWITIFANQIKAKKWNEPIVVLDIENAVFAVCVSFEGQVADLIDTDAFYQAPFVVIRITGYNPPAGTVEHYSEDPREPAER